MIEVDRLRKEYGELVAVDEVSFRAEAGAIYGLLGPNGAGKSTTIGCISGLLRPTSGSVRVLGRDVVSDALASRESLGVVPQELALYEDLTARENLRFFGGAWGLRGDELRGRVAEVLERAGLSGRAREPVARFSGGMKRRLNFACGVLHRPQVLLLDEPTVGVDPQSRVRLLDLVREEAAGGTCVLYTTHYMEEAESLCDRIGIIDGGRLVVEGTLAELRERMGERDVLRLGGSFEPGRVEGALREDPELSPHVEVLQAEAELLVLAVPEASRRLPAILSAVSGAGGELRETTMTQPSLESLFIELTGKDLRQ